MWEFKNKTVLASIGLSSVLPLANTKRWLASLLVAFTFMPSMAFADITADVSEKEQVVPKFSELLAGYEKNIRVNERLQALTERDEAVKQGADSWLASDIGVVIHHETDVFNANEPVTNWQLGVSADIKWPKQRQAMANMAKLMGQGSQVEMTYWRWLASSQLRALIWDLKQAQVNYNLDKKALSVGQKALQKIKLQVEVGERSQLDQMFIEQEVLALQSALQSSQVVLQNHRQAYQKWTGYSLLPNDINETLQLKVKDPHPKKLKLQQALNQQQGQLALAQSEKSGAPNVYLGLQQDKQQSQKEDSIVLEMTLPLGVNPQQNREVAQQKLALNQLSYELHKQQKDIDIALLQIRTKLKSMQKSLSLSDSQLNLAEQAYRLSEQAYRLGETNIQTLLKAQQGLIQFRKENQMKNIDYGRLVAEYNQQAGYILGEQP